VFSRAKPSRRSGGATNSPQPSRRWLWCNHNAYALSRQTRLIGIAIAFRDSVEELLVLRATFETMKANLGTHASSRAVPARRAVRARSARTADLAVSTADLAVSTADLAVSTADLAVSTADLAVSTQGFPRKATTMKKLLIIIGTILIAFILFSLSLYRLHLRHAGPPFGGPLTPTPPLQVQR